MPCTAPASLIFAFSERHARYDFELRLRQREQQINKLEDCLLYTSDAADEL